MYCKFCSSPLSSDSNVCQGCGAVIDKSDYGQTFFKAEELAEWSGRYVDANVPKTKMIENDMCSAPCAVNTIAPGFGYSAKRNKGMRFSSNKLIVFCIVSVLIIVLLVVAAIKLLNSDIFKGNNEQTIQTESEYKDESIITVDSVMSNKSVKENIVIMIDEVKAEHPVSIYQYDIDGTLYISADHILTYLGYGVGSRDVNDNSKIVYVHSSGEKIEIVENTCNFVKISEQERNEFVMKYPSFNDGSVTYVPVRSFFENIGYSVGYDSDTFTIVLKNTKE